MRILWLSHLIPFPSQGGGVIQRSSNLLKAASRNNDVTLLAFNQPEILRIYNKDINKSYTAALEAMNSICKNTYTVEIDSTNKLLGKHRLALRSLFTRTPYSVNWLQSTEYIRQLMNITSENQFDLIWFDTISLAQYEKHIPNNGCIKIMNHHNIESDMMLRRSQKSKNALEKLYFFLESIKLKSYEKKNLSKYDINVTCSHLDSIRLEKLIPDITAKVIPNGVDTEYFKPKETTVTKVTKLIFIGGMSWYPNKEAMLFFTRNVWPLIKQLKLDVEMHIVGELPPKEITNTALSDDNFYVHGFVKDIRDIFNQASIYVCPISDGGGTKLKILDALAMGKPIIANPIACEGIDVTENKNVLYAETPEDYINHIKYLMNNTEARNTISKNNIQLIKEKYSYDVIGQKLNNLLQDNTSKKEENKTP